MKDTLAILKDIRYKLKRPVIISAIAIAAIAVLEISLSSPLFAVLGFEYSTLMGLALSFVCGIVVAGHQGTEGTLRTKISGVVLESILLALVPLVVSVISLPFIHNCSFIDGLVFYIEIAIPSAVLGGLFGLAFQQLFRSMIAHARRTAILGFTAFWIISLFFSLLPGYTNPQLFTYGWQYGFFPGFIWDESLELTNTYLFARIEHFIFAAFWIALSLQQRGTDGTLGTIVPSGTNTRRIGTIVPMPYRNDRSYWIITIFLLIASVTMIELKDEMGITVSHRILREHLSDTLQITQLGTIVPTCTIHYAPGSLTDDERVKIDEDVRWYLHDIRRRFLLSDTTSEINIYIYPTTESFFEHVGSRVASIAKPWLGELHITKRNLVSLKHELTHVLLREKGVFPFYASWSTGLTEGAAMSVEPEYDGLYTLDEHAARILQLKYATGVKEVMSFTGFAANASSKSYVLAGSFSRFLLAKYGPARFDNVYSSLDFEKEYGKPIDSLESEWKQWLAPLMTSLNASDSAHFRYYYDRTSIVFSPCLRRIGKLDRSAGKAYEEKHFNEAVNLYRAAITEGGGVSPLLGEASALLRQDRLSDALLLLDTTSSPAIRRQYSSLDLERADLKALAGAYDDADTLYDAAEKVKIDSRDYIAAYAHRAIVKSDIGPMWLAMLGGEYKRGTNISANNLGEFDKIIAAHKQEEGINRTEMALQYERSSILEQAGNLKQVVKDNPFSNGFTNSLELNSEDSLAISLIALHYAQLLGASSAIQAATVAIAEEYCPMQYRRAVSEIANEIKAEQDFQQSPQRVHAMYH